MKAVAIVEVDEVSTVAAAEGLVLEGEVKVRIASEAKMSVEGARVDGTDGFGEMIWVCGTEAKETRVSRMTVLGV